MRVRASSLSMLSLLFVTSHACGGASQSQATGGDGGPDASVTDGASVDANDAGDGPGGDASLASQKIQHVVVIMQENRSFDHYFGTFPGAEGIPMDAQGNPTVCVPDPNADGACVAPYHDTADKNAGGPHTNPAFVTCVDGGKMDGFIKSAEGGSMNCADPTNPNCTNGSMVDVMGYHTDAEIPNYWSYAKTFALHDHMFQTNASWSYPMHVAMVSAWSASCTSDSPMACSSDVELDGTTLEAGPGNHYPWTEVTWLLHKYGVTWSYYLSKGMDPHCGNAPNECPPVALDPNVPSIWNPLPDFDDVTEDGELGNVQAVDDFYNATLDQHAPERVVDHPVLDRQRASAGARQHGPGIRHLPHQLDHAVVLLGQHRHLPGLGRLGRVLRPRRAAGRRLLGLRHPRPRHHDQPVGEARDASTSRSSATTPTSSSSRTSSSAASASIHRPTVAPTRAHPCARTRRSSET